MNPVFWFLVIVALILFWCCVCSLFYPLGSLVKNLFKDAVDCMKEESEEEKE